MITFQNIFVCAYFLQKEHLFLGAQMIAPDIVRKNIYMYTHTYIRTNTHNTSQLIITPKRSGWILLKGGLFLMPL